MSPRTRELGFLIPAALVGVLGTASVASAQSRTLGSGAFTILGVVVGLFVLMHIALRLRTPFADPYLLPIVATITALGMVTLYRINPVLAREQVLWLGVATAVFILVLACLPDHHLFEQYRYLCGLAAVGLLMVTMIFGTNISGAKLWIRLPGGQSLQPSELTKILLVLFLAGYLRDKRELLAVPTRRIAGIALPPVAVLGPVVLLVGACLGVLGLLNDFGTPLLYFGVFIAMLYIASGRGSYVVASLTFLTVGAVAIWAVIPHVQTRVDAWLHPFADAQGQGYQIVQSLYALANAGLIGPGWGQGFLIGPNGNYVVPVLDTDFIFTAYAAELGFIGAMALLCLFIVLVARGLTIAAQAPDGYSKLLAAGLATTLGIQGFVIIGGIVRVIPLTGVTLPFMSYGGSSVVTNFAIIAMLSIISHRSRVPFRPRVPRAVRAEAQRQMESMGSVTSE
jgi:cell division protein FtsW (lipid II flippase)